MKKICFKPNDVDSGGDLETFYKNLKDSYEDGNARAAQIQKRINTVEKVASDLFAEWEADSFIKKILN